MNLQADSLQLTLDQPHDVSKYPRAWYLLIGLCCLPSAFSLLLVEPASAYWNSKHLGDADFAALVVLLVGSFSLAKALSSDMLKVCAITIAKDGLFLTWSHIPQIFGGGVNRERHLLWDEIEALTWIEGESDLDLRQYLQIEFKEEIEIRKMALKVLVSDDQNEQRCKKIMSLLPSSLTQPEWLKSYKKD
jgi:hypothetical protein